MGTKFQRHSIERIAETSQQLHSAADKIASATRILQAAGLDEAVFVWSSATWRAIQKVLEAAELAAAMAPVQAAAAKSGEPSKYELTMQKSAADPRFRGERSERASNSKRAK